MSEDGSDQEQEIVKEPVREEPGKRFFVSHLNSYTGRALCRELRNDHTVQEVDWAAHTFAGTLLP